ncbi:dehydrogenase [Photobacterium sanctipauli]|uniref:Dehydrogenase n=1 Tax=Photobacterium sanctipauli TaxID=1342794 RepID=A0A2T3NNT6_9GAMM|nr:FAD binding domain-containing protein [Photobacterium sanctipauli]PSW17575.1 dehydrogenase [Photobacterium sanctipauli]
MVNVYRPDTLPQALDKLAVGEHTVFAGGTDLMVRHSVRSGMAPNFAHDVVFVDAIEELRSIRVVDDGVHKALYIGAAAVLADLVEHPLVPAILRRSVAGIAAPALRNRATLAGNICNASPAADSLPALYVLDAKVVLKSVRGQREIPLAEFIQAPGLTTLKANEMLTEVVIPCNEFTHTFYHKVGTRAANALSKLSVAGLAKVDGSADEGSEKLITDWRVAFGAVGPTVVRSEELESLLVGQPVEKLRHPAFLEQLVGCYSEIICPIDDQRSTARYRHQASVNLLRRWLEQLGYC